jgi:hypothetical protein
MRPSFSNRTSRKKSALFAAVAAAAAVTLSAALARATTWTCAPATDLTKALTSSALGDTIVLTAGNTFTGTFTLPNKTTGSGWITIQSSNLASLPAPGVRVSQADAINMPKIQAPIGATGTLAIKTSGPAHHYKFVGVEFIGMSNNAAETILIQLGENTSNQTQISQCPHDLIFDRCIARANSSTQPLRRAFAVHTGYVEITNGRIAYCMDTGSGDSPAISIANGPGPFVVSNCYLEAASEPILVGGSPINIVGMVPSNLTVTRCHIFKPLSGQGTSWNVKNLFELKAGNYVSLDGNRLENCWHAAGDFKGTAISIKRIAQPDQGNTWTSTDNVHINNNVVTNVGIGVSLAGSTEDHWGPNGSGDIVWTAQGWPKNVTIRNNLFDKINGPETWAGNQCHFFDLGSGGPNTTFDHNSAFGTFVLTNGSRIAEVWGGPYTGFAFKNNMLQTGQYNFRSTLGNGEGTFDNFMPTIDYQKNVTKGVASSALLPTYHGNWSPTSLAFPADFSTVLVNYSTPGSNYAGYKVLGWDQPTNPATYPYHNTGTDGKDIGCDIDYVNSSTGGCVSGVWAAAADSIESAGGLGTTNGGFGFGNNSWVTASGFNSPAIATGSMTYTDGTRSIITKGDKLQPAANSRAYRNFASTITTAGKTLWVSFRANNTGTGTLPTNHAGFQLCDATNGGGTNYIFLGKPGFSATNWGFDHAGSWSQKSGAVATADRDALLLYKLVFTGTQVTISMWVDPPLTEVQLPAPVLSQTFAHTANIASVWAGVGGNSTNYQFDEFRMSPVFTDVTK